MLKRIFSLILCIFLMLSSLQVSALAGSSVNGTGKVEYVIMPQYKNMGAFEEGLIRAEKDGKQGFLDRDGNVVVPFVYDQVYDFINGIAWGMKDGKFVFIDKNGKEKGGYFEADYIDPERDPYRTGFDRIKKNNKTGVVDLNGNIIAPPIYDFVDRLDYGMAMFEKDIVMNEDGWGAKFPIKRGYLDTTGKEIIPGGIYTGVNPFYNGRAVVTKDRKYAIINSKGEIVVPFDKYEGYWDFQEGLCATVKDGKVGYINTEGEMVIQGNESYQETTEAGDIIYKSNKKYGFINDQGKELVPCIYDYAQPFSNGLAIVARGGNKGDMDYYRGGKFGGIDITGKEVIPCKYDYIGWTKFIGLTIAGLKDLVLPVSVGGTGLNDRYEGGKWGYVNASGQEITPLIYDRTFPFNEGFGRVMKDGKYGFVDATGKEIVPCMYDQAYDFYDGMACVSIGGFTTDGRWGYVDTTGEVVIPIEFDSIWNFIAGTAMVRVNGKEGQIKNNLPVVAEAKADIKPGTYNSFQTVSLSCDTEGAIIYYELYDRKSFLYDDRVKQYTGPIKLYDSAIIKAFTVKPGMQKSAFAIFEYTIEPENIKAVTASVKPGTYPGAQTVSLKCATEGVKIYYTTDGKAPTAKSALAAMPLTVDKTATIKAIAVRDDMVVSPTAVFDYVIRKSK